MGIDKLSLNTSAPTDLLMPSVRWGGGDPGVYRKHFGESIPDLTDIRNNPVMLGLFSRLGMLARIQRKLNTLSRKKGKIVPAKKTIACALRACEETDFQDLVFAGVEFLAEYQGEEETIAGVLAHEWGHLISDYTKGLNPDEMTWDEIFDLRKDEEASADSFAGKMLFEMGYSPEGMIRFLNKVQKNKTCLKYHSPATRAAIIRTAYAEACRRQRQKVNLKSMFQIGSNPFTARLIAVA